MPKNDAKMTLKIGAYKLFKIIENWGLKID
jgi:hypothetical protein